MLYQGLGFPPQTFNQLKKRRNCTNIVASFTLKSNGCTVGFTNSYIFSPHEKSILINNSQRHFSITLQVICYAINLRVYNWWHGFLCVLTTPADGIWMLGIIPFLMWFIRWHNTTPSASDAGRSSGNDTLRRLSIPYDKKRKKENILARLRRVLKFQIYVAVLLKIEEKVYSTLDFYLSRLWALIEEGGRSWRAHIRDSH